ncbi:autophagy protein 18 [Saccharata proteae CBS 121410]|uniref:Autophagy protein 18 n=1 Tax=Saccharata proteae CBS 121410 TaxID=1314787 RepID=A0A9P4HQ81_9PEZI|nr:autophagy protein 18 [Saccharata proteae CBS 121410]
MNFVTFNQDYSALGVATKKGIRLYDTEPFSKYFEGEEGDVSIMEMLFSTSLVALIQSPRLLRIRNTKRHSTICELTFPTRVLAVRLNRKRLVVVLEDQIYLYDISNMKMLHTIETSPNPHGIIALSPSSEKNYLVYPLPKKDAPTFPGAPHAPPSGPHVAPRTGELLVFDAGKMEAVNVIEAHQAPLSCITLNNEGTLLATASEKGTIIRVFSIPDSQKLYQFRRGSIPAKILSMSFNSTSTLLCVSSATDTVHIFRLAAPAGPTGRDGAASRRLSTSSRDRSASPGSEEASEAADMEGSAPERKQANPGLASMIRRTSQNVGMGFAAKLGGYLPSAVAEIWEPSRDFAWVKIPKRPADGPPAHPSNVVAMSNNGPQVMVVTNDGSFLVYSIDLEKGGEGTLLKHLSVLEPQDRLGHSTSESDLGA